MSDKMLRQVLLSRPSQQGFYSAVFWIDNDVAKVGKKVKDEDGHVWEIKEIYNAHHFKDVERQIETWNKFREVLDGH